MGKLLRVAMYVGWSVLLVMACIEKEWQIMILCALMLELMSVADNSEKLATMVGFILGKMVIDAQAQLKVSTYGPPQASSTEVPPSGVPDVQAPQAPAVRQGEAHERGGSTELPASTPRNGGLE